MKKIIEAIEDEIIRLINEYRVENGSNALVKSEKLMEAAAIRAKEISAKFSHTRPDGTNAGTVSIDVFGEKYGIGENINSGSSTAEGVFNGWKNSPGHNKRGPSYRENDTKGLF